MRKAVRLLIAALLLLSVFVSCDKHAHDNEYGLAVAFTWQDLSDVGTPVHDIRLWIYNEEGKPVGSYHFSDVREAASQLFPLRAGKYSVVAAVNLSSPLTADGENKSMEELLFTLDGTGSALSHAWYGVAGVTISAEGVNSTDVALRRLLSELTVTITGAPEGTVLTGQVTETATGIFPAVRGQDGFGLAAASSAATVLPKTETHEGYLQVTALPLMPTAKGTSGTSIEVQLTSPDGNVQDCTLYAPPMEMAGKYVLDVCYDDLRATVRLSAHSISDWVKGWTIDREITDPVN